MHNNEFPDTPKGWCDYFRKMDGEYNTDPNSPLHHDNRCGNH